MVENQDFHIEVLQNYLTQFVEISPEGRQALAHSVTVCHVNKKELILNAGEVCDQIYFVSQGLLRTYHSNDKMSEFTRLIVPEGTFFTILDSFQNNTPSPASIEAVENTFYIKISKKSFTDLITGYEAFNHFYQSLLEEFQKFQLKRIQLLTSRTAQERWEVFITEHPELYQRLPKYVVASYLNISPETLSRIEHKNGRK